MAFQQSKSVKEMFLSAIIKTYMHHVHSGHIKDSYDQFQVNVVMERFFTLSISDHLMIENQIEENRQKGITELTEEIKWLIEDRQKQYHSRMLFLLLRKDRCKDIFFQEEILQSVNFNRKDRIRDIVKQNFKSKLLDMNIHKIDMMLRLGAFRGIHYVNAVLVKMDLIKDKFIN